MQLERKQKEWSDKASEDMLASNEALHLQASTFHEKQNERSRMTQAMCV